MAMTHRVEPGAAGQGLPILAYRAAIVAGALLVSYLLMAAVPLWLPSFPFLVFAASGVVLGGLWLLVYTWMARPWAALSVAAAIYLILGLVWLAILGATSGVFSVILVLAFTGVVLAASWPVLRRHAWAMPASLWSLVVLGMLAILVTGIVAGEPTLVAEGLLYTVAWPTMTLWFHGCELPFLTACPN